jgi:hypothetical protein
MCIPECTVRNKPKINRVHPAMAAARVAARIVNLTLTYRTNLKTTTCQLKKIKVNKANAEMPTINLNSLTVNIQTHQE